MFRSHWRKKGFIYKSLIYFLEAELYGKIYVCSLLNKYDGLPQGYSQKTYVEGESVAPFPKPLPI